MKLVSLATVADVQLGKMLSPKAKTGRASFRYMRNANVQWGRFDLSDLAQMDFSDAERSKFELRFGDLLVCEGGEPGRCAVWRNEVANCYYQKALHRVRPRDGKSDSEFLSLWIRYQAATGAFADQNAKTTIAHLPQVRLEQLLVPDIEVPEQRQIAARLKAQLAEVESAQQAAQVQVQDTELLRRCVLQTAFDALQKTYSREACLKDVCHISAGGTPSRGNGAFFKGDIPWVKTLDLNFGLVTDTEEKITPEAFRAIRGEMLPIGTVMVAMYGGAGTIGKSGILGTEACTNQAVCALQPNGGALDSEFLHHWLCYIRPEWMRHSGGNRKDPNINKSVVENMTLPMPPLDEQHQFTQHLNAQLAEADVIVQATRAQLAEIERLPQKLLAQAFNPQGDVA